MSAPDRRVTRRGVIAGVAMTALIRPAAASDVPFAERFVTFDPPAPLRPTTLIDRNGHPRVLTPRPGRLSLIALWATWCPACRRDLPQMAAAQRALARAGLDVAAVNIDAAPLETAVRHAAEIPTDAVPMFFDPDGLALAAPYPDGHLPPLRQFGMPILFLIGRDSRVLGYVKGAMDWSDPNVTATLLALGEETRPERP